MTLEPTFNIKNRRRGGPEGGYFITESLMCLPAYGILEAVKSDIHYTSDHLYTNLEKYEDAREMLLQNELIIKDIEPKIIVNKKEVNSTNFIAILSIGKIYE